MIASAGYTDVNIGVGTTVQIRICKATIKELQDTADAHEIAITDLQITGGPPGPEGPEGPSGVIDATYPITYDSETKIVGIDSFGYIAPGGSGDTLTGVVHDTGNENVGGIKTFTSLPVAPTAAPGTSTTQLATTAFVTSAISVVTSGGIGLPVGTPGSVQFNNSGSFGGFGNWSGTALTVPGDLNISGIFGPHGGTLISSDSAFNLGIADRFVHFERY